MELGELGEPVLDSVGEAQARRVFAISLMSRTACMLAVAACFGTENQAGIAFLAATFFCQIVFGVYAMVRESRRRRRQNGVVHA